MGMRTEIERVNDWSLTWLDALIVTERSVTDWGIPDIIPDEKSIERPDGRDPEVTE